MRRRPRFGAGVPVLIDKRGCAGVFFVGGRCGLRPVLDGLLAHERVEILPREAVTVGVILGDPDEGSFGDAKCPEFFAVDSDDKLDPSDIDILFRDTERHIVTHNS